MPVRHACRRVESALEALIGREPKDLSNKRFLQRLLHHRSTPPGQVDKQNYWKGMTVGVPSS